MATQTRAVASFEDATIVLSFDWDDVSGELLTARCVNDSPTFGVHVLVQGTGTGAAGRSWDQTFDPQSGLTQFSIPIGQRPLFPIGTDRNGDATVVGYYMRAELVLP